MAIQSDETPLYVFDHTFASKLPHLCDDYNVNDLFMFPEDMFEVLGAKRPKHKCVHQLNPTGHCLTGILQLQVDCGRPSPYRRPVARRPVRNFRLECAAAGHKTCARHSLHAVV